MPTYLKYKNIFFFILISGRGSGISFQLSRVRIRGKKCRILIPAKKYLFIYIKLFQSFLIIITLNKKWLSFPTLPCADRQQVSAPVYQTDPWSQEYIFRGRYIVYLQFIGQKHEVLRRFILSLMHFFPSLFFLQHYLLFCSLHISHFPFTFIDFL